MATTGRITEVTRAYRESQNNILLPTFFHFCPSKEQHDNFAIATAVERALNWESEEQDMVLALPLARFRTLDMSPELWPQVSICKMRGLVL